MTDRIRNKLDRLTALKTDLLTTDDDIEDFLMGAIRVLDLGDKHNDLLYAKSNLEYRIKALEAEIKKDVTDHGATVKGSGAMAVFSMRSSWDSKGLKGYAVAHPELLSFLSEKASVSIRTVKPKEPTDETPTPKTETPSANVQGVQKGKAPTLGNLVVEFAKGYVRARQAQN